MRAAVLLACALSCGIAAPLAAQTQVVPFHQPQPPFGALRSGVLRGPISHPIGEIGPDQVGVDQDGDELPDVIYDLPPAIRRDAQSPARWSFEDRLSPTQRVLYTHRFRNTGGAPNPPPVCDNDPASHEVFFHRLDTPPVMTLLGSACLRGPLSRQPAYYEPNPAALLRTAMVVAAPNAPGQEVAWFDLASGGAGEDGATYQANVSVTAEGVLVSPFGNAFYIRHRTGSPGPPARYSIVDLCADRTGGVVTTRDEPAQATGTRVEHRQDAGGLSAVVTFSLAGGGEQAESFALANCFGGSPPVLRRLTVTVSGNGGVGSNPPGIACGGACAADFTDGATVRLQTIASPGAVFSGWSGDCSGTQPATQVLMDADRACTATFGTLQLAVAKAADASSAVPGQTLTYTLTASNLGNVAATNVVVSDTLPAGADFVAAPGGTFGGAVATWSLGTIAAGGSAQAQLQVRPRCQVNNIANHTYSVDADLVFPVLGTAVTTPVTSPPTSPVTVVVTSVPDRLPLRAGDRITHTLTLTNTGPADHPYLRLVTHLGDAASLDALVDAGTGAFSFVPPTTLTWTGPLAAGATTSLVLRVRIDDCFGSNRTWLDSGSPVDVFNFCSQRVGSGQPPGPFALQRPVEAVLTAVDPRRTTQGTLPAIRYVAGRPGEPFDLQLTVTNNFAVDASGVTVNAALPIGLSAVGDPPFVPPTDPGAAWNAATRTVSWSGTVPASGGVTVTFRVAVDVGARCWTNVAVQGNRAGCSDIRDGLVTLAAPLPPATPHAIAVDVLEGLYLWEPGVDRNFRELLCVHAGEFHAGLGRTAGGDLWMAGLPTFRANLSTLELEAFAPGAFDTPAQSFEEENDVAGDPTDGTVVVLGGRGGVGGLTRYDPPTGQVTDVSALPTRSGRVVVEPDGTIAALAGDRIHRLDPANPQTITFPGYAGLGSFDRDADGDYVVLAARASGGGFAEDLVEVDPVTGVITTILADLDAATGNVTVPHGPLAVAPDGAVYLTRADGRELYRVDRSTVPPTVTPLSAAGTVTNPTTPGVFLTSIRDLVFVGGAPPPAAADLVLAKTASPDPVAAGARLTFALTATNLGPDAAAQVVVTDPLPAGVTFDPAASDARCVAASGTVTCALGDLPAGQAASVTVVVAVDPPTSGVLTNTATVSSATTDPGAGNDTATASVSVSALPPPLADLGLTKTAAPDPLVVGQDLTYTLTVGNAGPDDAFGARVTDVSPTTLAFVPSGSSPACTAVGSTVTCELGTVRVGATAVVTVTTRPLLSADLGVSRLEAAPAGPAIVGESLVYTVDVTNFGPGDARGVRLTTLAPGFDASGNPLAPLDVTLGSAQASRGSCAPLGANGGPPVVCALGNLRPGESARVTIVATPNAATTAVGQPESALVNAARVTTEAASPPDLDPHAANDERSVRTIVLPADTPDLAVSRAQAQPADPLVLGGTLTYAVEVVNFGSAAAADVRLYTLASGFGPDGRPAGPPLDVTVLSVGASQGTCVDSGGGSGPVECALGTLTAGARAQVTVVVQPNSATVSPGLPPAPLISRSRVTTAGALAGTPVDPHVTNDVAAVSSVVLPATGLADLAVTTLEVTPAVPVVRGAELVYVLRVTNFGPEPAPDVVVYTMAAAFTADGRPAGPPLRARLVSLTPSQGSCADDGNGNGPVECLLGTLAPGASARVDLVVSPEAATVTVGAPDDPLINGASVTTAAALSGNDLDPHGANNRASAASTVLERLPDTIDNTAVVSAGTGDPDPTDDVASVSTPLTSPPAPVVPRADLGLVLSGPPQAALGVGTTYTVTVTNAGPDPAPGTGVLIALSPGLTLAAVGSSVGSCAGSQAVSCQLGDLPAGGTASVTLVVRPRATGVQVLASEVVAFGTADPAPGDNQDTASVTVEAPPPQGENIDPAGAGEQYAYGENAGWINLEPLGDGGPGVEVGASALAGWMWGENVGWCSLSCLGTGSCGTVDFGVTNDGQGQLAGFAWCENAGWISFSCANTASCAAAPYGVVVDPATGVFGGEAWGENIGWIAFGGSGTVPYRVATGWRGGP